MSDTDTKEKVQWHLFAVGSIMLVAGLVAFFWAFSLPSLSPSRRFLLLWILPLASGFACGSFAGSIRASASTTIACVATGGFAVWLLTSILLGRVSTEISLPADIAKIEKVSPDPEKANSDIRTRRQAVESFTVLLLQMKQSESRIHESEGPGSESSNHLLDQATTDFGIQFDNTGKFLRVYHPLLPNGPWKKRFSDAYNAVVDAKHEQDRAKEIAAMKKAIPAFFDEVDFSIQAMQDASN